MSAPMGSGPPPSFSVNFGPTMGDFGRDVLKTVVETDYGKDLSFDRINFHPVENHGGHGPHSQVNLWAKGVDGRGLTFRFLEGLGK